MTTVETFSKERFEKLDFLTKAIARVHGPNHPELKDVREEFLKMKEKAAAGNYDYTTVMTTVETLSKERFEKLDFLTKAIARVNGPNHPELKDVREEFLKMK